MSSSTTTNTAVISAINQILSSGQLDNIAIDNIDNTNPITCPTGTLNDMDFTCFGPLLGPPDTQFSTTSDGFGVSGHFNLILGTIANAMNFQIDATTTVTQLNQKLLTPVGGLSATGSYSTSFTGTYNTAVYASVYASATANVFTPAYCTPQTCTTHGFCTNPQLHGGGCCEWWSCFTCTHPIYTTCPPGNWQHLCTPKVCFPSVSINNLSVNNAEGELTVANGTITGGIQFNLTYIKPNGNYIEYSIAIPANIAFPTFYISNVSFNDLTINFSNYSVPTFILPIAGTISDPMGWSDQQILNLINTYGMPPLQNLLNNGFKGIIIQIYWVTPS
jgi:hypothetical protein